LNYINTRTNVVVVQALYMCSRSM